MNFLQEIVKTITGGIVEFAKGLGGGINEMIQSLLFTSENQISAAGIVIVSFAGLALAIGLTKFITKWIMSLGARK